MQMHGQKKCLSQVVEGQLWSFVVVIVRAEPCLLRYLRRDKRSRRSLHIFKVAVGACLFVDTLCASVAPFMVTSAYCTCERVQGTGSEFTDVLVCVFEAW